MAKRKRALKKTQVYIVGESPLVEEYAELCAASGFHAHVHWNQPHEKTFKIRSKSIGLSSVIPPNTSYGIELTNTNLEQKKKNLQRLDRALAPDKIILSSSVTVTATEQASWMRQPGRLIGISALPSFLSQKLVELSPAIQTERSVPLKAQAFFIELGRQVSVVQDRVGMVLPRIICTIINEAYFALQENIASPEDIDLAMILGTNYPHGPIEWAAKIGVSQVGSVLAALQADLHEDRYRIAPLLQQLVTSGEWWKAREA